MKKVVIEPYDINWSIEFINVGMSLRDALGETALRIDHIGSTAIPGMAAKPIIDIQISVKSFEPLDAIKNPIESLGYMHRDNNPDQTKLYFREDRDDRNVHIHVRKQGSWSEQFTLLFRDYLREHPEDANKCLELKYRLADEFAEDREAYTDAKTDLIGKIMMKANIWSQDTGWEPSESDA